MFSGSFELSVDEKGRIAVPARYRAELGQTCGSQLVVTQGPDEALEVYPAPEFQKHTATISSMEDRQQAETLMDWFVGFAVETEVDKAGRMLLPPFLRKRAGINGSIVLVGKINRFDVWARDAWAARFEQLNEERLADRRAAFWNLKR